MWLALYGTRRQLLIALAATVARRCSLPWALIGGDQYPASTPRSALLVLAVAAIAGLTIQRLLGGGARHPRPARPASSRPRPGTRSSRPIWQGTITVFNPGAERMLGYRAEEVVGVATPAQFLARDELAAQAVELGIEPTSRRSWPTRSPRAHETRGADLRAQGRDAPARRRRR